MKRGNKVRHAISPTPQIIMKVLLAAPAGLFTEALRALLGTLDKRCDVTHCAAPEDAAQAADRTGHLDLVLLDTDPLGTEAPRAIRELRARFPELPVVALATPGDNECIDRVLDAGALGYLPKTYTEPLMLGVLRLVLSGATYRPHITGRALTPVGAPASGHGMRSSLHEYGLTDREIEVLSKAAEGRPNLAIARQLGIAEGTVKLHMSSVFRKLNVENRAEAIILAQRLNSVTSQQIRQAESGTLSLETLLPHMSHRHFHKDEIIFRKGDQGQALFYLQRGTVSLKEIGVEMSAGTLFGEIGIFAPDHSRTCTAQCKTEVDLFTLTEEQVKRLYYLNPQFALHVVHLIAQRLMADKARSA